LAPSYDGFFGEGDLEALTRPGWSVQIGAYSSKPLAQKELEEAAFAGGLMERTRSVLAAVMDDGRTLYRARFTKLTEIEAATACEALKDKSVKCFVVSSADAASN